MNTATQKEIQALELSKAAELVGVSAVTLFRELRARKIIDDKNMPLRHYVETGFFRQEFRQFNLRGYHITRYYSVTLITPAGMALLSEIARDIRHGRSQSPQTHRTTHSRSAGPCSQAESAERCAAIMTILGGNACAVDFRAA